MLKPSQVFPPSRRLRQAAQFKAVRLQGQRFPFPCGYCYFIPGGSEAVLGVVISKRQVARAHRRNQFKRVIREWFRRQTLLPAGQYVFIITKRAQDRANAEVTQCLNGLLRKFDAACKSSSQAV